ncbi:ShlB/FhaC/HecB family hemolysin secretion/activation protein [Pseudomonas putida]
MRPLVMPLFLLPWASLAHAQALPSFLDGHENERRLPTTNLPVEAYRPVTPGLRLAAPVRASAAAQPMNTRLVLRKVRFEGGTVFALSDLRDHYQPLIGQQTTVAELQQFTERLTQRYRQDGYLLSYAYLPAQDYADGRVRVVLVEGYVHDYQLTGDIGPASAYLVQLLERLKAERPLTRATLDRYLGLAERVPGVTVQAELTAAEQPAGATRLSVQVRRKPFGGSVTVSDGSRDDGQALFNVYSNAHSRFAERLEASLLLPPGDDQAHYQRLGYSQYLDAEGSQLLLSAARYRSRPRTPVRLQHGVDAYQQREGERYALGLAQPLIVRPDEWMAVTGRFYAASEHIEALAPVGSDTSVRAVSFEGDWRRADAGRLRIVSAGVYQGLDYLGAGSDADYDLDFLRLRLSGLQSDRLHGNWQGVLSGMLAWSDDSLPDSERAVFGGQQFARGYPRDQAAGDKGWGVAYELNYSAGWGAGGLKLVQPYAVIDAAQAWYNGGPIEDARLSSVALGVRVSGGGVFDAALEVARPLADDALDSHDRAPRFNLSVTVQLL